MLTLKETYLIVVPETPEARIAVHEWKTRLHGHVFHVRADGGAGIAFQDLGAKEVVCNQPINITSAHPDKDIRLIGNFADTPFELDGVAYRSIEGFWQGLKFSDDTARRELAAMSGADAQRRGREQRYGPMVQYRGEPVPVGTWHHWQLMQRACRAKFTQHAAAGAALRASAPRPLVHRVRKDSRTIPGVIMADIWMRIRRQLVAPRLTMRLGSGMGRAV